MRVLFLLPLLICLSACATYTTPGGPVSLLSITEVDIAEAFAMEPAASFPARLAIARVQAPDYVSGTNDGYGNGAYSVVTRRDIETEADFVRVGNFDSVSAVAPLTRLLLPRTFHSTQDLRKSAAMLKADILLLYTMDTEFRTETTNLGPLQTISLGFLPNRKSQVIAVCTTIFIDVRTGFVYGTAEASSTEYQRSNLWGTREAIESARLAAETSAFRAALTETERLWHEALAEHGQTAS